MAMRVLNASRRAGNVQNSPNVKVAKMDECSTLLLLPSSSEEKNQERNVLKVRDFFCRNNSSLPCDENDDDDTMRLVEWSGKVTREVWEKSSGH